MSTPKLTIGGDLNSDQKTQLETQFKVVYLRLPPLMKARLEKNISFDHYQLTVLPLPSKVAGEVHKSGEIIINKNILGQQELVARVIIHELAHIYDMLKILPPEILSAQRDCEISRDQYREYPTPEACELYKDTKTTVSTLPDFLDATGWFQELNGHGQRLKESTLGFRSPDPYEATNPREMFAVNMEYFISDPEYPCRRPSIYRYLSKHFAFNPSVGVSCKGSLAVIDPQFDKANQAIQIIDPSRVYAIHYLIAGSGEQVMSAFGHSMIRIVMCSAQRKTVGPECLNDIEDHIVLSFRAFVDSPQINGWAGLTGAYSSRLFFIPFPQIIDEYNVSQLRDLSSYPLALSREEIKSTLERALEVHWSYKNNYYFLSNNCAVEILNLIKVGIGRSSLMNLRAQTPKLVLKELQKKQLISNEISFDNLDVAMEKGYYFFSYAKKLQQALDLIKSFSGRSFTIDSWSNLNASDRRQIYQSLSFQDPLARKKWSASFLFFERYIEKQVTQNTYNRFLQGNIDPKSDLGGKAKVFVDKILNTFSFDQELTGPASFAKAGYGIPTSEELISVQDYLGKIQLKRDENQSAINSLLKELLHLYGDEISQIKSNKLVFAEGLRN